MFISSPSFLLYTIITISTNTTSIVSTNSTNTFYSRISSFCFFLNHNNSTAIIFNLMLLFFIPMLLLFIPIILHQLFLHTIGTTFIWYTPLYFSSLHFPLHWQENHHTIHHGNHAFPFSYLSLLYQQSHHLLRNPVLMVTLFYKIIFDCNMSDHYNNICSLHMHSLR